MKTVLLKEISLKILRKIFQVFFLSCIGVSGLNVLLIGFEQQNTTHEIKGL